jgi:cytochrome c oxidase cbb3-type subunit 3
MAKDRNELLGHAEDNDGIQEYDNAMPDWWLGLFFFTIVWSVGYVGWFTFGGQSQTGWYEAEMAQAAEQWPQKQASFAMTPEAIAAGAELYSKNCVGCHLPDLSGSIGPNLTDDVWIHGGSPEEIMAVITNGVPAKGMITWGPILGPEKISHLAAFILSKKGTAAAAPAPGGAATPDAVAPEAAPAEGAPAEAAPAGAAAGEGEGERRERGEQR